MIYKFGDYVPVIDESSFVHPLAAITGHVIIGKNVYVGPFAAIRGDWGCIIIKDGCNIQESCTLHVFPGVSMTLEEDVHVGHGAVVHGANIGRNSLIGMNAVLMDEAHIGEECIVGALSFVRSGTVFERRSVIAGNPAKVIKEVSDEMIKWKSEGTAIYQSLPQDMKTIWEPAEPLREVPKNRPPQRKFYKPWK